jgi:methyl-accepting chemotaxis protein
MDSALAKGGRRYLSLRVKIWLGFILIFTPVFVASYYWFYQYTTARVFQTITDNLQNTISGAIKGMDVEGFVKLYQQESANNPQCPPPANAPSSQNGYYPENDPLYIAHENWLHEVQEVSPNTRLYTYVKGINPGEIIAIGSTGYFRNPRGGFRFCERYTSKSSQIYNGLTQRVDAWTPYTDSFGSWITTYEPIADSNGKLVGAIGVDISANYVDQVRSEILLSGAIAFIASYALIFLLVYWLSGLLTRPILSLAGIAKEIGEGKYDQEWSQVDRSATFRDEINTLTSVFHSMVEKVAEREKSLRARVAQLEIMIDHTKLESQVREIVDSDFFQDLQSKVQDMRSRFKEQPPDKK